jgi:hypothetical protein
LATFSSSASLIRIWTIASVVFMPLSMAGRPAAAA